MLEEYGQGSDDSTRLMAVAERKRGCGISNVKALQRGGPKSPARKGKRVVAEVQRRCDLKYSVTVIYAYNISTIHGNRHLFCSNLAPFRLPDSHLAAFARDQRNWPFAFFTGHYCFFGRYDIIATSIT